MNTPNPLVPQGSLQEQSKKKSQVRIIVFSILAVHVVLLGVLLIQGCKREEPAPVLPPILPLPVDTNPPPPPPPPPTNLYVPPTNVVVPPMPPPTIVDVAPPAAAGEHTVVKGDTFATIAKKYGVSVKAIQAANPGVDSRKLKLKQKLVVPAQPPGGTPTSSATTPDAGATAGEALYTVKKGDTLTKIAKANGTTIKAIRAANNLKTDQIKPNQKLKVPGKTAPVTPAAPTAPAVPALPAPPMTPMPSVVPPSGLPPSSP